ncbi:hypothetical protein [Parafrigoribacterium soli]|uniref:hypothetical protein n=1 Tax=Parafrigoribacterium soli TaxID=3144663 RepID=UPI0032ED6DF1
MNTEQKTERRPEPVAAQGVLSHAERSWRLVGAIGMIAGMLSLVVTTIVQWTLQPTSASDTIVGIVNAHQGVWAITSVLSVLGPLLWVAGIGAITSVVRDRGWVLTTVGGSITALGLIAGVGHLALFFGLSSDLAASSVSTKAAEAVQGADDGGLLGNLLLILFLVGFSLGPILLTVGLRRARLVAVWVPVAAIVMVVANFVGGIPAGAVQLLAMLLAFGPLTIVLLRRR